jgi:hypothetical protein
VKRNEFGDYKEDKMKTLNTRWRFMGLVLLVAILLLNLFATTPITSAQQPKKKMPVDVFVTEMDIQSLSDKLDAFDRGLSRDELGAMNLILRRAASAPADNPDGTEIRSSFFGSNTYRGDVNRAIVVQGGRTEQINAAGSPGGRPAITGNPLRAALGGDTDPAAIGPKHEDPMPAPDTINALDGKLRTFGGQLSAQERGIIDWLLQRASAPGSGNLYGTPGGRPPTLFAALGSRNGAGLSGSRRWLLRL